jgi:hypothetical protein
MLTEEQIRQEAERLYPYHKPVSTTDPDFYINLERDKKQDLRREGYIVAMQQIAITSTLSKEDFETIEMAAEIAENGGGFETSEKLKAILLKLPALKQQEPEKPYAVCSKMELSEKCTYPECECDIPPMDVEVIGAPQSEPLDEVTHEKFFGENINRMLKALKGEHKRDENTSSITVPAQVEQQESRYNYTTYHFHGEPFVPQHQAQQLLETCESRDNDIQNLSVRLQEANRKIEELTELQKATRAANTLQSQHNELLEKRLASLQSSQAEVAGRAITLLRKCVDAKLEDTAPEANSEWHEPALTPQLRKEVLEYINSLSSDKKENI